MTTKRWLIAPLVAAGLALAVPGTAQASTHEAESSTSVTVAYTVRAGDTAWQIAASRCGSGYAHTRLTIRSTAGALRANHNWIWPGDSVRGVCSGNAVPVATQALSSSGWVRPVVGAHFGRGGCFGDPRDGGTRKHKGVDLSLPSGRPIVAAHAGTVVRAGWWSRGYGISILISHGRGLYTHYAHASRSLVHVGQQVKTGDRIALVGTTGHSSGPHLHYEVWSGWWHQIAPRSFMAARGVAAVGC